MHGVYLGVVSVIDTPAKLLESPSHADPNRRSPL